MNLMCGIFVTTITVLTIFFFLWKKKKIETTATTDMTEVATQIAINNDSFVNYLCELTEFHGHSEKFRTVDFWLEARRDA
jgi:hypothetical protein